MLGKRIWTIFGKSLRFGTVTHEKIENGWKFIQADWVDDEKYEDLVDKKALVRNGKMPRGCNLGKQLWYRIDEVNEFQPEETIETLRRL